MKISNVANFLWVGNQLSLYETKCIESFVANGFVVNVYAYGNLEIPKGANLLDGRNILPETEVYSYTQEGKKGDLAAFSDAFRFKLVKENAGWWFDTDVFCLKHVDDWVTLAENKKNEVVLGWEAEALANGAIIFSDCADFDNQIQNHLLKIGKEFPWGEIGPRLITQVIKELNLEKTVLSKEHFYPIYYDDLDKMFDPDFLFFCQSRASNSFCVHLWNELFKRHQIPKNLPPPVNSYMYELLSLHSTLNSEIALPNETTKILFKSVLLEDLIKYKNNIESKKIVKVLRNIKKFSRKFHR